MKPFLHGRPVHSSSSHRKTATTSTEALANAIATNQKNAAAQGPTVECIKQGDKVTRLIVTCSCGERIEVECLYPAGG